jgi:acyl-coenzyme A thioesterase PaaI-like protein
VCSKGNEHGLQLDFIFSDDGSVSAAFSLDKIFEGYPDMLHGGILCLILDGAMTNCLFAHDCIAVTADFRVRFRHPVVINQPAQVRAWISRSSSCLYELQAEISQNSQIKTTATGKFMKQPHLERKP